MAVIIIVLLFLILCNTGVTAAQATNEEADRHPFLYWSLFTIVALILLNIFEKWGWI